MKVRDAEGDERGADEIQLTTPRAAPQGAVNADISRCATKCVPYLHPAIKLNTKRKKMDVIFFLNVFQMNNVRTTDPYTILDWRCSLSTSGVECWSGCMSTLVLASCSWHNVRDCVYKPQRRTPLLCSDRERAIEVEAYKSYTHTKQRLCLVQQGFKEKVESNLTRLANEMSHICIRNYVAFTFPYSNRWGILAYKIKVRQGQQNSRIPTSRSGKGKGLNGIEKKLT